ncbi:hypothetical protein EJ377_14635 [Chryseobacterium arthrosphaerae]|uniref:Uncharacterized protein n=1 Tax=Chryseobacterium arthrosphaerae TaxID=651561 RepID=A0A3S0VFY8_9FLAO|nr:hypothetical protein EJ377_14635 [Chryseobacterium arthrosphaerae]
MTAIPKVQKLSADNDRFYFITNTNKIYAMTIGSSTIPVKPVATAVGDVYGFNVIDGKIFAADANYTTDGKVNVYDAVNGNLLRNFTAGIGTNGFYKIKNNA